MAVIKHSKQRDAILTFLMSRKDHPTADVVYEEVSKEFPNISLGTVYRNLTFLVEHGHAVKVPCNDGSVHFDGNVKPHNHFQCTECGAVIDLDFDEGDFVKALNNAASQNFQGEIEGNVTFFYGRCPKCCKKKEKEK
ncbi:MAG: transcriptional repressor [Lachnospira sp.]|nr:transcriptional repressor [Lachnospira sp.]